MKIVILGAGRVGSTLAEELAGEQKNEVTVVDTNPAKLQPLQDRLDIRTVTGRGSYPRMLKAADTGDCDMLIAVTEPAETNLTAGQVHPTLTDPPAQAD